jgi:hypothetical protein
MDSVFSIRIFAASRATVVSQLRDDICGVDEEGDKGDKGDSPI